MRKTYTFIHSSYADLLKDPAGVSELVKSISSLRDLDFLYAIFYIPPSLLRKVS